MRARHRLVRLAAKGNFSYNGLLNRGHCRELKSIRKSRLSSFPPPVERARDKTGFPAGGRTRFAYRRFINRRKREEDGRLTRKRGIWAGGLGEGNAWQLKSRLRSIVWRFRSRHSSHQSFPPRARENAPNL